MTADMTATYLLACLLACGSDKSLNTINGENENENEKNLFPTLKREHYRNERECFKGASLHKLHTSQRYVRRRAERRSFYIKEQHMHARMYA